MPDPDLPTSGGDYVRDPKTGQLTRIEANPPVVAADPEPAPVAPLKKDK